MMDAFPSPPATAEVLTNTDLLHGIFTFVPLASSGQDSYLAWCTAVCRIFHEPAIRVLWRRLDTLLPLWHLLAPADAPYPFGDDGRTDNILLEYLQKVNSAQLCLDPTRWDRFLWHAAHVRRVIHLLHPSPAIRDATRLLVRSVVMQNGGNTFLPLLHTILWRGRRPMRRGALVPFFTSTLRDAAFDFVGSADETIVRLLRRLRESAPFLEEIAVLRNPHRNAGPLVIQELLCFTRLNQIRISGISGFEAFRALVTKPYLTRLIGLGVTGPWVALGPTISVHDLRELSVTGDASTISGIFNLVRFPALKSANICLHLSARSQIGSVTITTFLALFYNAVSAGDLQTFEFEVDKYKSYGNESPLLRDLINPILPIHSLRSFSLLAVRGVIARIDEADIHVLATAWPKLERLRIDSGIAPASSVSIGAIHCLYTHCTHLKELSVSHIRFPAIGVHEIPAPLDRSLSHPLRHLSVAIKLASAENLPLLGPELSDEGAEAIARYLLDLFPSLDPQQYKHASRFTHWIHRLPPTVHFEGRWHKVIGHICSICSARDGL